ncbi:MAG TPA: hypothetical protein VER76_19590 [Pyrinomonadaceae bacterium]|nr:hypothetical protein [Pyrinomonadaceae bacterium]
MLSKPPPAAPRGEAQPTVWTVGVSARLDGEVWRVNVSVGMGEYYDGGAQQVGSYALRTNERAFVREMVRYGVNPVSVGVVKVLGAAGRTVRVTNGTQSISVEKLEARTLPEPYRVSLKNNSSKDVVAVQINSYKLGQFTALRWRGGDRLNALIKAGESYRMEMVSEDRACAGADGYRPTQTDRVEISSVVFADGSYEGTAGLAALIRAKSLGHIQPLGRVVELINSWNDRDNLSAAEITHYFRSIANGIEEVAEPSMLNDLLSNLPEGEVEKVPSLGNFLRHGQHEIKTNLLGDAQELESLANRKQEAQVETKIVAGWLTRTKAKYVDWLAAAQAAAR